MKKERRCSVNKKRERKRKAENKKWEEKQLYGYFKRQTKDIAHEMTWTWFTMETSREKLNLLIAAKINAKLELICIK